MNKIKELRKEKNITVAELAKELGISQSMLTRKGIVHFAELSLEEKKELIRKDSACTDHRLVFKNGLQDSLTDLCLIWCICCQQIFL